MSYLPDFPFYSFVKIGHVSLKDKIFICFLNNVLPYCAKCHRPTYIHTHTHTHTQTHRHTDTQTHRQTHRHTDTQTHRQIDSAAWMVEIEPGFKRITNGSSESMLDYEYECFILSSFKANVLHNSSSIPLAAIWIGEIERRLKCITNASRVA